MRTSLLLAVAVLAMAQTPASPPSARCRGVDGKPCTAKQIQDLSDAVFAGKQKRDALASFRELTLLSRDGTFKCTQNDGSVCTTAQLDAVKEIAAAQQIYVNYNSQAGGKK